MRRAFNSENASRVKDGMLPCCIAAEDTVVALGIVLMAASDTQSVDRDADNGEPSESEAGLGLEAQCTKSAISTRPKAPRAIRGLESLALVISMTEEG